MVLIPGVVVAVAVPTMFQSAEPDEPPWWMLMLVGLIVIAITAAVLRWSAGRLGLSQRWLTLALAYNALIIVVKLWLSPASLYQVNQTVPFDTSTFDPNEPFMLTVLGLVLFALYALVFTILKRLGRISQEPGERVHSRSGAKIVGLALIVTVLAVIGTGGSLLLFLYVFVGAPVQMYLTYLAQSIWLIPVAASLLAAIALAASAWREVNQQSASNPALPASFFWLGLCMIGSFQVLWVVYLITLSTLWPFKTYTPK
jgi:hypothetical protein